MTFMPANYRLFWITGPLRVPDLDFWPRDFRHG